MIQLSDFPHYFATPQNAAPGVHNHQQEQCNLFELPAEKSTPAAETFSPAFIIFCDGLCEPFNPGGWATWGWIAFDSSNKEIAQNYGCIGHGHGMTNNLAEWQAVLEALQSATILGWRQVLIKTDSRLVVNQLLGVWACNSPHLLPMRTASRELLSQIGGTIEWVPRVDNEQADLLTRKAYAEARGFKTQRMGKVVQK